MVKEVEQVETISGNVERKPHIYHKPTEKKDIKEWLLKTEDLQVWGPFSYRELLLLSKGKKLTLHDYVAKSCSNFEPISDVKELQEIVNIIPDTNFDEITDKTIDRDFQEDTMKSTINAQASFFRRTFDITLLPLNTVLWIILFILITSYCLYYVSRY